MLYCAYMNINSFLSWEENQKIIAFCPVCKNERKFSDAFVIAENNGNLLLYVKCLQCFGGIFVNFFETSLGANSLGIVTDLEKEDIYSFKDKKRISLDDALSMFKLLEKNKEIEKNFQF